MPPFKLPPSTASVSDLLDASTAVFRMTLAKALPAALFAALLGGMSGMYWQTTGKPFDFLHPPLDPTFWMLAAVGMVCYLLLTAMVLLRQRAMMGGAAPDLAREASAALQRWPMLIATYVLGSVATFAGFAADHPGRIPARLPVAAAARGAVRIDGSGAGAGPLRTPGAADVAAGHGGCGDHAFDNFHLHGGG